MTSKTKWTLIGILTYCIFIIVTLGFNLLAPNRVGITWTVFWYVAAALIIYYLCFKNWVYHRVLYYARKLELTQADLAAFLPDLKQTQEIPNPNKRHLFSPLFTLSLQNLDTLDRQVKKIAKTKNIDPYK
ncbi:hypothetical protein PL11_002335 [Lentilactobacillus curieae]|uniref:Uncharacterized protein n=1 Tax=Lentilactobacillus curieae TaxID=1138822 RepID=A0A1S6QGU8_9LACO|nr:hypothetical protein [Lentilactobacillus curieae]AQW20834.1 hypothetical protein PL11_002335 [Lentilactobacillus curieae]